MQSRNQSDQKNFQTSLWTGIGLGALAAGSFFALIVLGPLDYAVLRRYSMGHPVSISAVFLFSIAIAVLAQKLQATRRESRAMRVATNSLLDLMQSMPQASAIDSVRWLDSMWRAQREAIVGSFFGNRLSKLLRRQIQRGSCEHFDQDLQDLADDDATQQHDAYSIVRIICWAMPMLGFLGTVVGISQTLGNMDMKLLASGEASAMDSLTAGLYIAFDTTAVGLVLTIAAMFGQFAVGGFESKLRQALDTQVADRAYSLLKREEAEQVDHSALVQTLAERIVDGTANAINRLIERQESLWREANEQSQQRWLKLRNESGTDLSEALKKAMDQSLGELSREVEKVQSNASSTLETRYQQWQTSFSEQSRVMLQSQLELTKQSEMLVALVDGCDRFKALDETVQQTLGRMTDVDRFHEAAVCLAEAVAMLGIQLERSGQIGKGVRGNVRRTTENNLFDSMDGTSGKAA